MFVKIRKILALVLTAAVAAAAVPQCAAAYGGLPSRRLVNYTSQLDWPDGPELNAEGAYLIELNSGAVLYSKSGSQQFYPASITKILTALVVIENCSLDEMVTFSRNSVVDIEEGGFSYIAGEGDRLSVRDLLYALMLQSSNEAAYALAEHCGGSLEGFAVMMNRKATELGATNSNFVWPHGLTNPDHVTTPHDMALIMWGAVQNETFLKIDSTLTYRTAPTKTNKDGFYCQMRHQMMRKTEYKDERVVAGKTGYISAAGNTLVTYARDGDKELIAVVMKVQGSGVACQDTKKLLDYGFNQFEFKPVSTGISFSDIEKRVEQETGRIVASVSFDDTIRLLVPNGAVIPEPDWELYLTPPESDDVLEMSAKAEFYLGDCQAAARDISISLLEVPTEPPTEETEAPTETAAAADAKEPASQGSGLLPVILIAAGVVAVLAVVVIAVSARSRARRREQAEQSRGRSRRRE